MNLCVRTQYPKTQQPINDVTRIHVVTVYHQQAMSKAS